MYRVNPSKNVHYLYPIISLYSQATAVGATMNMSQDIFTPDHFLVCTGDRGGGDHEHVPGHGHGRVGGVAHPAPWSATGNARDKNDNENTASNSNRSIDSPPPNDTPSGQPHTLSSERPPPVSSAHPPPLSSAGPPPASASSARPPSVSSAGPPPASFAGSSMRIGSAAPRASEATGATQREALQQLMKVVPNLRRQYLKFIDTGPNFPRTPGLTRTKTA